MTTLTEKQIKQIKLENKKQAEISKLVFSTGYAVYSDGIAVVPFSYKGVFEAFMSNSGYEMVYRGERQESLGWFHSFDVVIK